MARTRSLQEVLNAIVEGIGECKNVALARIWLVQPGDICETCRFRQDCQDRARCLHLVASAGNPVNEGDNCSGLEGEFRRFPIGNRKIGHVGATGSPLLVRDVQEDRQWFVYPKWAKKERIQTFAAQPLVYHDEILGVLGIFDRTELSAWDFDWMRMVADHAAVSIANARAFEEIADLKSHLEEENDYLRNEVCEVLGSTSIVGTSLGLTKVLEQIQLVAATDATVLIHGESGTGKELVARDIHEHSARRDRGMIKVNCGAVPENLFESEFFGHVKGAFTGALKDKPGRFELADGGTLFLDEVGEIPLSMQAKLLRVLQEQEMERVGDSRSRKVDVRIIAATNRNLAQEVEAGRFREDLYYRLSVFPIELPPLRERCEDIEPLAQHFVNLISRRMHREPGRMTRQSMRQLKDHDWPGNVRELQNVIERAVILSRGGVLRFDLPTEGRPESVPEQTREAAATILTSGEFRRLERSNIIAALKASDGKISGPNGAAEILEMKPTTLASRIKALGI